MNVFDAIYGLRATRVYDRRPVPRDTLDQILEAATRACSSGNTQPWEFVVVTRDELKKELQVVLRDAFTVVDARRAQQPEQLVDGAGRAVTGHAAVENVHPRARSCSCSGTPTAGSACRVNTKSNPTARSRRATRHPAAAARACSPRART
jgi:hypothetical protein